MKSAEKQKRGCIGWLGSTLVALAVLLGFSVLGTWLLLRHQRNQWTDAAPLPVAVVTPVPGNGRGEVLYRQLQVAMRQGQATELELSSTELNQLVQAAPELAELRRMAAFQLEDDHLVVDLAAPLQQFPGMSDRFLNGRFAIEFSLQDGEPSFQIVSGTVKGRPVPASLLAALNRHGGEMVRQRLRAIPETSRFAALAVSDGRLRLQLKAEKP